MPISRFLNDLFLSTNWMDIRLKILPLFDIADKDDANALISKA